MHSGGGLMIAPPAAPVAHDLGWPGTNQYNSIMESPPRAPSSASSRGSTITGIILDRDWSGRTFNIPDCPSKDNVGSLKDWYIRNICPTAQHGSLRIVRQSDGSVVSDQEPFWRLAEGEGEFTVTVTHVESTSPRTSSSIIKTSPTVTIYVQHDSTGISTTVQLPSNSTLLQLKIASFEQLGLGDAVAALDPRIGFTFNNMALDNEASISACEISDGDRIFIGERRTPPTSRRGSRSSSCSSSPAGGQQHTLISEIWSNHQLPHEDLTLPSALLEDDYETACLSSKSTMRCKPCKSNRYQTELEKFKQSYRTKMCRSGAGNCRYGNSCWFAHTHEELRNPTDPLPAHCPGVSKLEKYARRQEQSTCA